MRIYFTLSQSKVEPLWCTILPNWGHAITVVTFWALLSRFVNSVLIPFYWHCHALFVCYKASYLSFDKHRWKFSVRVNNLKIQSPLVVFIRISYGEFTRHVANLSVLNDNCTGTEFVLKSISQWNVFVIPTQTADVIVCDDRTSFSWSYLAACHFVILYMFRRRINIERIKSLFLEETVVFGRYDLNLEFLSLFDFGKSIESW